MIEIRKNMFETNSSSCHVFVYDPKGSATVQKIVTLIPNNDDSILNILFNDYYCYFSLGRFGEDYLKEFLNNLLAIGVTEVKCPDESVVALFEKVKAEGNYYCYDKNGLIQVLFNDNTELTTLEDFGVCQETIDNEFGEGLKYYSIRLS